MRDMLVIGVVIGAVLFVAGFCMALLPPARPDLEYYCKPERFDWTLECLRTHRDHNREWAALNCRSAAKFTFCYYRSRAPEQPGTARRFE